MTGQLSLRVYQHACKKKTGLWNSNKCEWSQLRDLSSLFSAYRLPTFFCFFSFSLLEKAFLPHGRRSHVWAFGGARMAILLDNEKMRLTGM